MALSNMLLVIPFITANNYIWSKTFDIITILLYIPYIHIK